MIIQTSLISILSVLSSPSNFLLVCDHLPRVAHEGRVEIKNDIDEEDNVHDGVDDE